MQNTLAADRYAGAVKFLLKDPPITEVTLVSLIFRYDNRWFVYSTGQFTEPYQWDADNQRAYTNQKNRIIRQQHETINAHLDRHRAAFVRVMNALQLAGGAFDNAAIKHHRRAARLDNQLGRIRVTKPAKVEEKETFTQFITRFVVDAKVGQRLNAKNSRFADGTLKNFMKFRNILTGYQQHTGRGLEYDAFTIDFYNRFKKYLTAQGHSLNYVGAVLNGVEMLLKHAHAEGLHHNTNFQSRDFKRIEEEPGRRCDCTIYLDNDELTTLYTLNLSHDLRLDRVWDLFLIGCYTGLRFSDYSELRPVDITYGGRILSVTTQKTAARVSSIPLNPNVLAILAKYEGVPPRTMSNQKFNRTSDPAVPQRIGAGSRIDYTGRADPHPGRQTVNADRAKMGNANYAHHPPFVRYKRISGGGANGFNHENNRAQVGGDVYEVYKSFVGAKRVANAGASAFFRY
jgi:hypothetical protein